jgi:hypothetical protein
MISGFGQRLALTVPLKFIDPGLKSNNFQLGRPNAARLPDTPVANGLGAESFLAWSAYRPLAIALDLLFSALITRCGDFLPFGGSVIVASI